MSRKLRVRFSASFDVMVNVEEGDSISDAVNDVDIPELAGTHYVPDSFDVIRVTDEETKAEVDWNEDDDEEFSFDDEEDDDFEDLDKFDDDDRNAYLMHRDKEDDSKEE